MTDNPTAELPMSCQACRPSRFVQQSPKREVLAICDGCDACYLVTYLKEHEDYALFKYSEPVVVKINNPMEFLDETKKQVYRKQIEPLRLYLDRYAKQLDGSHRKHPKRRRRPCWD